MPASSLWSFSAFSFSKAAICLSILAQFGLTALMSRMAMGVAQSASARLTQHNNTAPVRISLSARRTLHPALKLAFNQMHEQAYSLLAVVETGNIAECLPPMLEEDLLILLRDLLKRLHAIGNEARGYDGDRLDALPRQGLNRLVGIGLDPFRAAEPRLEGELELRTKGPERLAQGLGRGYALLLIRIALVNARLRKTVKRGEDRLRFALERCDVRSDRVGERGDIDGVGGVRRNGADRRLHAERLERIEHLVVCGCRRRRGVLRIKREGEQPVAPLGHERLDAGGYGRRPVAHGPIDHDAPIHWERLGHFLGLAPRDGAKRRLVALL